MNDKYIFNIPKNHISALLHSIYPKQEERDFLMVQECGEFLQAFSKYKIARSTSSCTLHDMKETRDKMVEEMTHVLVCFGMLAYEQDIRQNEIDEKIKAKAIDGVMYPFEVKENHVTIEDLLKSLELCNADRSEFPFLSRHDCDGCVFSEAGYVTLACRPMIQEVLYYLNKYAEHKQSVSGGQNNEDKTSS